MSFNPDVEPYCYYDDIKSILLSIMEIHENFLGVFQRLTKKGLMNLNKKQVRHVCKILPNEKAFMLKDPFYSLLKSYLNELNRLTVSVDLEYTYAKYDLRLRVKQNESIVNKIKYYQLGKAEAGRYALNKCLNDLLGFRICINGFQHNCEYFRDLCGTLETKYKIKCLDASKGEYRATHIYIHGENNKNFPWELQVWDPHDFTTNEESHKKHKQEYVAWASVYKNSFEYERGDK